MAWFAHTETTENPTQNRTMNLNRRLSFLATILCAFAFLFATGTPAFAAKKKEKTVGTVKVEGGGSIKINGKTAGNGAELKCGDTIETGNEPVDVALEGGKEYTVDPGTKVRITCSPTGAVALLVIYGGVHPVGGDADYLQPLPWLAAFANGNSSFPSIGGGASGRTISTVLPTGQVVFTTVSE
jgi:hypothetical protein